MMNVSEERFYGLVEQIDHYFWIEQAQTILSEQHKAHLRELRLQIAVFGKRANKWVAVINDLLNN